MKITSRWRESGGGDPQEIETLALNLSGARKGVPGAFQTVRKDRVYLVDDHPALVNGKGIDEGVTVYDR